MAFNHGVVSFVMFSSNIQQVFYLIISKLYAIKKLEYYRFRKEVVTYEMMTATIIEKSRLNFDQIIIRGELYCHLIVRVILVSRIYRVIYKLRTPSLIIHTFYIYSNFYSFSILQQSIIFKNS